MLLAIGALILIGGVALWLVVAFGDRGGAATRAQALTDLQPSDGEPTPAAGHDDDATGASHGSADSGSTYDDGGGDGGGGDGGD